jgi:hypothetical protein
MFLTLNLGLKAFNKLFFINCEEGVIIINGHDRKYIYFTFSKCYHHLHLVIKCAIGCEI